MRIWKHDRCTAPSSLYAVHRSCPYTGTKYVTGQSRAEQGRAGQGRAGQGRAGRLCPALHSQHNSTEKSEAVSDQRYIDLKADYLILSSVV
jgi:hypothetical protein